LIKVEAAAVNYADLLRCADILDSIAKQTKLESAIGPLYNPAG